MVTDALVEKLTAVVNEAVTQSVASITTLTRTDIKEAVEDALKDHTAESEATLTAKEVEDIVKTYVIKFTANLATTADLNQLSQQLDQLEQEIIDAINESAKQ